MIVVGTRLDVDEFHDRYIGGRDPYPWDEILPLAGIRYLEQEQVVPYIGVMFNAGIGGVHVNAVTPDGSATNAGVREGDILVRAGEIVADGPEWANQFRARYAKDPEGTPVEFVVVRDGSELALPGQLGFAPRSSHQIDPIPDASEKAVRIRNGILTGTTD
jgi:predicted metalloprotease with PDZ domain